MLISSKRFYLGRTYFACWRRDLRQSQKSVQILEKLKFSLLELQKRIVALARWLTYLNRKIVINSVEAPRLNQSQKKSYCLRAFI